MFHKRNEYKHRCVTTVAPATPRPLVLPLLLPPPYVRRPIVTDETLLALPTVCRRCADGVTFHERLG